MDKIRFATDKETFNRAVGLYELGKITKISADVFGVSATVVGTKPYHVYVSAKKYDQGSCDCYLGQHDTLCKHMVALAIWAVLAGQPIREQDKKIVGEVKFSNKTGRLSEQELDALKKEITANLKYIKSYNGPSRVWFAYQNSLDEGCARLTELVSKIPASLETAKILIDLLLRLDKKLSVGGVDDSNGTVGGFMEEVVSLLLEYKRTDLKYAQAFEKLKGRETAFGWEDRLL